MVYHKIIGLLLFAGVLFFPFLGGVHLFDWDEINFAEISREMLVLNDYLRIHIDFEPFYQKPPLFFWLQALSMRLWGVGEYAARFPNAVFGLITIYSLFLIGKKLKNAAFGWTWALAFIGSILPFIYFKSGIIDPVFNLFIFLSIVYLFETKENGQLKYIILAGIFAGLAILTKGPVAILIIGLVLMVVWIKYKFRWFIAPGFMLVFAATIIMTTLMWFGLETVKNGSSFMIEFTQYQYRLFSTPDAGHKGFPGYHAVILLLGCFPASIFFFRGYSVNASTESDFGFWMKAVFWIVLILFTIVQSKIVHYSSLNYFPISFLAARAMQDGQVTFKEKGGIIAIGVLMLIAVIAVPSLLKNPETILPYIQDDFAKANLGALVDWKGWEYIPFFILALILILFIWKANTTSLFLGMAIFSFWILIGFARPIEGYSQNAAIELIRTYSQDGKSVVPMGYKSYAHLFYSNKKPDDKPRYIITKIQKVEEIVRETGYRVIESKNGFVILSAD
jgi:4-amino-4-deoxy-L-arabinose transferase-like glycosyltransferase